MAKPRNNRNPIPTVADMLAAEAAFTLSVGLGAGRRVKLSGSVPDSVEASALADLALNGQQPVDKAGRLRVKCPDAVITAEGVPTGETVKRSALADPVLVAKCIYSAAGLPIPDDLAPPADPLKVNSNPPAAQAS